MVTSEYAMGIDRGVGVRGGALQGGDERAGACGALQGIVGRALDGADSEPVRAGVRPGVGPGVGPGFRDGGGGRGAARAGGVRDGAGLGADGGGRADPVRGRGPGGGPGGGPAGPGRARCVAAARRTAPGGARVTVRREGDLVRVRVEAKTPGPDALALDADATRPWRWPRRRWGRADEEGEVARSAFESAARLRGGPREGLASDRGSATVWTVGAIAVLCVVFGVVLAMGQAVVVRHRAGGAADLAALAAADHWMDGGTAACAQADRVARAQGARVVRCAVRARSRMSRRRAGRGPFARRSGRGRAAGR